MYKQNIPKVSKFNYPKGSLCGSASDVVSGVAENNYNTAVTLLKEKFGSKEYIIVTVHVTLRYLSTFFSKFNVNKHTHYSITKTIGVTR